MAKIIVWVRENWLLSLLMVLVVYLLVKPYIAAGLFGVTTKNYGYGGVMETASVALDAKMAPSAMTREYAPVPQTDRMVVQDTDLSLLVKDVAGAVKKIEEGVVALGGYMVNKSMTKPEGAAYGSITVRVPVEKREQSLEQIRSAGVKVVSENVSGRDVTDQYVDIAESIAQLENTKTKMQALLDKATRVSDLVEIQNQLNYLQRQIDSYKGQQEYLEKTAKMTRIVVSLSTDEMALPYAPDKAWRPEVVFKNAVRSMIQSVRSVLNTIIWMVVYAPLVVLMVVCVWMARRVWMMKVGKK